MSLTIISQHWKVISKEMDYCEDEEFKPSAEFVVHDEVVTAVIVSMNSAKGMAVVFDDEEEKHYLYRAEQPAPNSQVIQTAELLTEDLLRQKAADIARKSSDPNISLADIKDLMESWVKIAKAIA